MLVMTIWHPGIKTRKQVTDLIASALCSPNYLLSTIYCICSIYCIYYLLSTQTSDQPDCLRSPLPLLSTVSVVSTVLYNIYSVDIYHLVSTIYCIRSIYCTLQYLHGRYLQGRFCGKSMRLLGFGRLQPQELVAWCPKTCGHEDGGIRIKYSI